MSSVESPNGAICESVPVDEMTSRDYYFDSYAHFGIHEEMLRDEVRMKAYKDAIYGSSELFRDKIVLDVGCGTGILSLFAADAGAKLVIGVEKSNIIDVTYDIVKRNGFQDKIVLLKGRMEDVVLPVEKVDIIISEWMGYCLLCESMLKTVILARDKYLKDDGLIFPDKAALFMATIDDTEFSESKTGFWDDVHGFDFSRIKPLSLSEPLVDFVDSSVVNSTVCTLKKFDLYEVREDELSFTVPFSLSTTRKDYVHAFMCYFEIYFTEAPVEIRLTTSPFYQQTHWKQTLFYVEHPFLVEPGDIFEGSFSLWQNLRNDRDLKMELKGKFKGSPEREFKFNYRLS